MPLPALLPGSRYRAGVGFAWQACRNCPATLRFLRRWHSFILPKAGIDIAVLEVGMGGRLDATNVVNPLLSIITDISLDHMEWLGTTIPAITREKAGILGRGGTDDYPAAASRGEPGSWRSCAELDVRVVSAVPFVPAPVPGALIPSTFWERRFLSSRRSLARINSAMWRWPSRRQKSSLRTTASSLRLQRGRGDSRHRWPGGWSGMANSDVEWILDVAHNPAGAWALRAGLHGILEVRSPRDPRLQLPARQAHCRNGADSVSALRPGDCCTYSHGTRRGGRRAARCGPCNRNTSSCGRIGRRGSAFGATSCSQWRGRGFRLGVPGGRSAYDAAGGKE